MPKHKIQLPGIILHPALCPNIFVYGKKLTTQTMVPGLGGGPEGKKT